MQWQLYVQYNQSPANCSAANQKLCRRATHGSQLHSSQQICSVTSCPTATENPEWFQHRGRHTAVPWGDNVSLCRTINDTHTKSRKVPRYESLNRCFLLHNYTLFLTNYTWTGQEKDDIASQETHLTTLTVTCAKKKFKSGVTEKYLRHLLTHCV